MQGSRECTDGFVKSLFEVILEKRGIPGVLAMTRKFTGAGFAFFDPDAGNVFVDSDDDIFTERCRFYPLAEILRLYRHWKIEHAGVICFIAADENFRDRDSGTTSSAMNYALNAALICRVFAGTKHSYDAEDNLLKRLILPDGENVFSLEKTLKKKYTAFQRGFKVAVALLRAKNDEKIPEDLSAKLYRRYGDLLKSARFNVLHDVFQNVFAVAFFKDEFDNAAFFMQNFKTVTCRFLQDTRSSAVDVHIGIGGEGRSIEDFPKSYEKALLSVKHEFWNERKKTVSEWEDLGAEQMLAFPSAAIEEGNILYGAICAMHSLQQKTGKTPFFSTLLSLVCNNWNITAAAANLSLHYNSMKYRYDRISEMLEADMDNPRTRLEISLLLKAYLYRMPIGDFFTLF